MKPSSHATGGEFASRSSVNIVTRSNGILERNAQHQSAYMPPVIHIFVPLTIQCLPSSYHKTKHPIFVSHSHGRQRRSYISGMFSAPAGIDPNDSRGWSAGISPARPQAPADMRRA